MKGIKSVSNKIINYLFKEVTEKEKEVMKYGLTILLSTLGGYLLMIIVTSLFDITFLALTAAITASMIRIFSGGVHASCFRNCSLTWTVVFTILGLFARDFGSSIKYMQILIWGTLLIGFLVIYLYAPAEIKEKPINSRAKRFKLKKLSFVTFFTLVLLYFVLDLLGGNKQFILAGLLGILWQMFTITPLAYGWFNRQYLKGGVRNEKANKKNVEENC